MKRSKAACWLTWMSMIGACGSDGKQPDGGLPAGEQPDGSVAADAAAADGWATLDYADESLWLCGPNAATDQCLNVDLTMSEAAAMGAFNTVAYDAAEDPKLDCFFVYPTFDVRKEAANVDDVRDVEPILVAMRNQIARFTSVCRVIVPLYRQMTIGTYDEPGGYYGTQPFERAYADVEAAFEHYMATTNEGRPFVLLGHSQGTHMLVSLVADHIEKDAALLDQLELAILLGPVGAIHVPEGKRVGGTFKKLPLCEGDATTKCLVAFDSKGGGVAYDNLPTRPIPKGMKRACVVPSSLAGGAGDVLSLSVWEKEVGIPFPTAANQPWVGYPGATSAVCEDDGMLGLSAATDPVATVPISPQGVQSVLEDRGGDNALHILDFNYSMGDLLRLVRARADAL